MKTALLLGVALAAAMAPAATRPVVAVGIPPLKWVVANIAGDSVEVVVLIKPGQSAHTFEPSARQVALLERAAVFLYVGTEAERTAAARAAAQNRTLRVHDVGHIREADADGHEHTAAARSHAHADPHIWLAPPEMVAIATRCAAALRQTFPELRGVIDDGEARTLTLIGALDAQMRALLREAAGTPLLVYHPSWGHFAAAYGLRQIALEDDGKAPAARHLAKIADEVKAHSLRILFSNPDAPEGTVRRAAATLGCQVEIIDPLSAAWDTNLLQVARLIMRHLPAKEAVP